MVGPLEVGRYLITDRAAGAYPRRCRTGRREGGRIGTSAERAYLDSEFDVLQELPRAGSALENPFVFDAAARELEELARRGLIVIVDRHLSGAALIDSLHFRRLR